MKFRIASIAAITLLLAACASSPSPRYREDARAYPPPAARCYDCGVVDRVEVVYVSGSSTGGGAVLGGIVGGVLGNQVGKGDGKKAATVAGVVGGAVVGNEIEKRGTKKSYRITVRMDDGSRQSFVQATISSYLHEGSYVRVDNGRVILLR